MATVTGLTAERMLEIEAESVNDGNVVGDDLILIRHDGSQINAGNVRGAPGPTGPMGKALAVVNAQPVLDVGLINQIRAGRQLTSADFTNMGLSTPIGLWNLSNVNDSSGNGRNLINKGAVPFGVGIMGQATAAAVFAGSASQALHILDTGAADPFRIRTGSVGCWLRTAKLGTIQDVFGKYGVAGQLCWILSIYGNAMTLYTSVSGSDLQGTAVGTTNVCDDHWHFVVATFDGVQARLYVDGSLDAIGWSGPLFPGSSPLVIGVRAADVSNSAAGTNPCYGRVDEAFISPNILSDDQIRNLYAASIPHALGAIPVSVSLNVRRNKRGGTIPVSAFPSQPSRLYNFTAGAFTDEGSNNAPVSFQGGNQLLLVMGADGSKDNAYHIYGSAGYYMQATDAGLPSGTAPRSFGLWFKTGLVGGQNMVAWGTYTTADARLGSGSPTGQLFSNSGADTMAGPYIADGQWHHAVVVEDPAPADGLKRKLYCDGNLVNGSTVLNPITLAGANGLKIGASSSGAGPWTGPLDGVFIVSGVLTADQVRAIYNIGAQALAPSPKNPADHIEALEITRLLGIFDTIESNDTIDLAVFA